MKIRKGLLAMTIGGTLAMALTFVQPASAQRVVIVRPYPYRGYRMFYSPGWWYYQRPAYVVGPAPAR